MYTCGDNAARYGRRRSVPICLALRGGVRFSARYFAHQVRPERRTPAPAPSTRREVFGGGAHNAPAVCVRSPAPRALDRHLAGARRPFAAGPPRAVSRCSTCCNRYAHQLAVHRADGHAQCPHGVCSREMFAHRPRALAHAAWRMRVACWPYSSPHKQNAQTVRTPHQLTTPTRHLAPPTLSSHSACTHTEQVRPCRSS